MRMGRSGLRAGAVAACLAASAATAAAQEAFGGNFLRQLFYGGSVPPSREPEYEVTCPRVTISPGGASINSYAGGRAGGPETLRSQISIVDVARECTVRPDGAITVKVGVQGRGLAGPGGAMSRMEAPVRFVIKRDEKIVASASRRAAIDLSSGQGNFVVVEDKLVVPAGTKEFEIEVGLGGSGAEPARRQRR